MKTQLSNTLAGVVAGFLIVAVVNGDKVYNARATQISDNNRDVAPPRLVQGLLRSSLHADYAMIQCVVPEPSLEKRESASECCERIIIVSSASQQSSWPGGGDNKIAPLSFCLAHLARMPNNEDEDDEAPYLPRVSHALVYARTSTTASGILLPAPLEPNEGPWIHHVWNETHQAWNQRSSRPETHSSGNDKDGFTAKIESTLSATGGMHRDLHSQLTIQLDETDDDDAFAAGSDNYSFSLSAYLFVPPDVFINIEDAFGTTTDDLTLSVHTVDNEVINQEEPSFVSPPHVVLVRIYGKGKKLPAGQAQTFSWDTYLHLRYPTPSLETNKLFASVTFPAPVIVAGSLRFSGSERVLTLLQNEPASSLDGFFEPDLITTWVAAAAQEDYVAVLGLTLVVALVGAGIMLRDIAKVAVWS